MTSLRLDYNYLGAEGAVALAGALGSMHGMTSLNFGKDVLLFPPMKNGKCKGAFGVENPTFYGFEWRGNVVVVAFIVAGYDPNIAFVFEADLGASWYMSCGME